MAASGVAAVMKTALSLKNKQLPASINIDQENPDCQFDDKVIPQKETEPWQQTYPRRAGVSSFGVGGTNTHIIMKEAQKPVQQDKQQPFSLMVISSKDQQTLQDLQSIHEQGIRGSQNVDNYCFTMQSGRNHFAYRQFSVIGSDTPTAINWQQATEKSKETIWLFPGQGSQTLKMFSGLYKYEKVFKQTINDCDKELYSQFGWSLLDHMMGHPNRVRVKPVRDLTETGSW